MPYIVAVISILVISVSILLGGSNKNWFVEFGLVIVVVSTLTSMILAFVGGRRAAHAEKLEYKSFIPPIDDSKSHSFKFTVGMMGVDTRNPNKYLQDQIDEIKKVAFQDEKNFRVLNSLTDRRIDICFAQIRYHESVTLPKILGQGSGSIIFSGVLTIIGSVYLAFPVDLKNKFSIVERLVFLLF